MIVRVLANRLQGLQVPEDLRASFADSCRVHWKDILARARGEFVLPAFAAASRDLDLLESLEPRVRAFLALAHAANIQRNSKLREQLATVIRILNQVGIEPVLLPFTPSERQ